jgi:hypothetical protein
MIYPDPRIIMEICSTCYMGLHDLSKNYKFTKPQDSSTGSRSRSGTNIQSSNNNSKNTNQVISGYMLPSSSHDDEDDIQLAAEED